MGTGGGGGVVSGLRVKLTIHLHLVTRLTVHGVVPSRPVSL
jgi:hypothetical protein